MLGLVAMILQHSRIGVPLLAQEEGEGEEEAGSGEMLTPRSVFALMFTCTPKNVLCLKIGLLT